MATVEEIEQNTKEWYIANRDGDYRRANELKDLGINPKWSNNDKPLKDKLKIKVDTDTAWLETYLRDKHTDIDIQDANGETAFTRAIKKNNLLVAGILLSEGANVNNQNINGDTALSTACKNEDAASVKYLLSKSADINIQNIEGETALRLSIKEQLFDKVESLLAVGADMDLQDVHGRTALMKSIDYKHNSIAELLIDSGANLELQDKHGNTAIMYACENGEAILVELLVRNGANINHANNYKETPLIKSLEQHVFDQSSRGIIARLLIDLGADVTAKMTRTPLMIAVEKSMDPSFTELLINMRADIHQRDASGRTALMMNARDTSSSENAQLLIANGAEIEIIDKNGNSPLSIAVKNNHLPLVRELLENGANADFIDSTSKKTMLMYATEDNNIELMKTLINGGADMNKQDALGKTALMYSAIWLDQGAAKLLIDHSADINVQDNKGQTAPMLAIHAFNPTLAQYMQAMGADTQNIRDDAGQSVMDHVLVENADIHAYMEKINLEVDMVTQEDIAILGPSMGSVSAHEPVVRQQTDREKFMDSLYPDTEEFHSKEFDAATISARCSFKLSMIDDLAAKFINQEYISKKDLDEWIVKTEHEKFNGQFVQDFGVSPDIVEKQNLFTACVKGDLDTIKSLNIDLNCEDDLGNTPLMLAARNGQAEIISFLVENQVDLDVKNSLGNTALMITAKSEHSASAQLLINGGADFRIKNVYGDTALVIANRNGDQTISALLESKGAVVEYNYGKFFETCKSGSPDRIAQMIADGYNVDFQDRSGGTALMHALNYKQNANAEILIKQGANLNIQTSGGSTALMCAVINEVYLENPMSALLIKNGADIHLANANGDTALSFAAAHGRLATAISLVDKGADHKRENEGGRSAWDIIKSKDYGLNKGLHALFEKVELNNMIAQGTARDTTTEETLTAPKPQGVRFPLTRAEKDTERMVAAISSVEPRLDTGRAEKIFHERQNEIIERHQEAQETGLDISR